MPDIVNNVWHFIKSSSFSQSLSARQNVGTTFNAHNGRKRQRNEISFSYSFFFIPSISMISIHSGILFHSNRKEKEREKTCRNIHNKIKRIFIYCYCFLLSDSQRTFSLAFRFFLCCRSDFLLHFRCLFSILSTSISFRSSRWICIWNECERKNTRGE